MKKIRFTIDSDLENVALVGMSVKKICSMTPFSQKQLFQVELCAVEAINNSIIHSYNGELMHDVEITLSINDNYISMEVFDRGKAMNSEVLTEADLKFNNNDIDNLEIISETGRGLGLIKEFMDKVTYRSNNDGNRLAMLKYY